MVEEQNRSWTDRYMLRFPDGMREQIKRLAEANNRSMNAEIISALEFHLSQNKIEELRAKHPPAYINLPDEGPTFLEIAKETFGNDEKLQARARTLTMDIYKAVVARLVEMDAEEGAQAAEQGGGQE